MDHGTLVGAFRARAAERADRPLWFFQEGGRWEPTTWGSAREQVDTIAGALASLGVEPGQPVGLLGRNLPQWVAADYAIQQLGAVVVPLYANASVEQIGEVLGRSQAGLCLVESDEQGERVRQAGIAGLTVAGLRSDALMEAGTSWLVSHHGDLERRAGTVQPDQLHSIIYTSGTTGEPKGVELSHHNLVWTTRQAARVIAFRPREVLLSYLPLGHVIERLTTTALPLIAPTATWHCWFVPELAGLPAALKRARPTIFAAVPSVFHKLQARVEAELRAAGGLRRIVARLPGSLASRRILAKVGLDRCWYAISGAAPLAADTQRFFHRLGLPLHQGWGLTESTALSTLQAPDDLEAGVVGPPLPGVQLRLAADGEVLVRGPNVFRGYHLDAVGTAAVLDREGWLRTGDIGKLVEGGRLQIVDRKKNLIVTSGGRKIAPGQIEGRLTSEPLIEGAIVIGDRRPYLVALIAINAQIAAVVAARDPVAGEVGLWEHPAVREAVAGIVDRVNRALSEPESIRRWAVLPFGFPNEAMTPTLKLKRKVVEETFRRQIEALYA
jgi:long-chain acyl-CoA synthetase